MDWFAFALGATSCGFIMSTFAMFYILGNRKDDLEDLDGMEIRGPFSTMDEVYLDMAQEINKETVKQETKDAKGKKSKVSEIKPKS